MRYLGSDNEININTSKPEFFEWKWIEPNSITDIVVSKNSDGDFTFYDGTTGNGTQVLKLFVKASDNGQSTDVINLTQALKIKHNAGLHVALDSSNTDYSMLINYYHSNTR